VFIRFRQTKTKLQVSLIESRRTDGKVRHEHIAQLGSIPLEPTIADRIKFWQRLHERMAQLSNRVGAKAQARMLGDIHARIPMVTPDEQRTLQRENAEADNKFWSWLGDSFAEQAEGHKQLSATAVKTAADAEASAAAEKAKTARERLERLDKGETVDGGLNPPVSIYAQLRQAGWTNGKIAETVCMADLSDEGFEKFLKMMSTDRERWEKRHRRTLLRRLFST
jgi:hypothetical protein